MIIREIALSNFGIYRDIEPFNLTPVPLNGFNRPVVLFSGKNGAGKTTITEAIRLCLHSSLALGNRVSQSEYESYLADRIHVPLNSGDMPTAAKIRLTIDHVSSGRKQTYYIERQWRLTRSGVKENLDILTGREPEELTDLANEQKEDFLRELVPPQIADVLFFDGEKLQMLTEDGAGSQWLASALKTLFGLNLVGRLQRDLDVYLARTVAIQNSDALQEQLEKVNQRIDTLKQNLSDLQVEQETNRETIAETKQAIAEQEQKIASEGKWYAEQRDSLKIAREQLEVKIEMQRRRAQELTGGLVPFAIVPQMCSLVANRLHREKQYEQWEASQQVLEDQLGKVYPEITDPQLWADIDEATGERLQRELLSRIKTALRRAAPSSSIDSEAVILRVSDEDRQTLLAWIDQALTEVPRQFRQIVDQLNSWEAELKKVEGELELVPSDKTLKPLVETLHQLGRELGRLEKMDQDLTDQIQRAEYGLEQTHYELQRVRQQIAEQEHYDQRIQLATQTQLLLEEYERELSREKIALLEKALTVRFNELCSKASLVDGVSIDSDTFRITLYRQRQSFDRNQLSAGEKQLLAVATIWALREVSNVPMPVIIDTPLGRLDSDHRLSMVQSYFPRASHQVVLLATDSEIDTQMLTRLAPAVSRMYQLNYDAAQGKTDVHQVALEDISCSEEVASR